jgi:hypothetical protein
MMLKTAFEAAARTQQPLDNKAMVITYSSIQSHPFLKIPVSRCRRVSVAAAEAWPSWLAMLIEATVQLPCVAATMLAAAA